MNEYKLSEEIERYLNGEMTKEERAAFDVLRKENAEVNARVTEHKHFTGLLKQYGERLELESRLDAIHREIDVHTLKEELMVHPSWIVQLWRSHHSKISVAASIAIFAVLGTLFFTGYLNNRESNYLSLRGEVARINRKADNINNKLNKLNRSGRITDNPGKYRGTGFAITASGLIATNYHVIEGADSVYVQNNAGKSFKAKVLYSEPENDIAILKIVDTSFRNLRPIPYTFKRSESDLAESVYTFGYSQEAPVYDDGKLTSSNGLNGDSLDYQISIPINPGNSGGPLLDTKGNIIGIVQAKQTQMEGVHFAVKSSYLLSAIDSLEKKVNLNTKNTLVNLTPVQQVKKLKNYVFMVKVYDK
ncbi:MAG TPA: S1C family serine protease [Mucilaginibacter sp.]|jgi:serine protease Do|nr:S1C family serine protease [Mucilaginibacter sp.]